MFKPNMLYPLRDRTIYGSRYRFALTQPGEIPKQCWLLDCWIVDKDGNRHPGYDAVPVPVRRDSVYISRGIPSTVEYEPEAFRGWR